MLGLTLREEFRGKRLKGTAIELSNDQHTGATQIVRPVRIEASRAMSTTSAKVRMRWSS